METVSRASWRLVGIALGAGVVLILLDLLVPFPVPPEWAFTWLSWITAVAGVLALVLVGKKASEQMKTVGANITKYVDSMVGIQRDLEQLTRHLTSADK